MCFGCFDGWKCCHRLFGKCICKTPKWHHCCEKVTDPSCISQNEACAAMKRPLDLALTTAVEVVDKSRSSLDAAKRILSTAQGVVDVAQKGLDTAVATLNGIEEVYRAGVEAINAISKFTLTEIINITEMYFKVKLSVANSGQFQCRVKGVLMGKNINVNLDFDARNPLKIAKLLGERAISGISKFIG